MRKIKTILLLAAAVCFSASLFAQAKKTAILASDPIGLKIKDAVKDLLVKEGFEVVDLTGSEHQNYVDVGFNFGREMNDKKYDFGFVFCGTGMGVNLVANKFKNVYCALCETEEAAKMRVATYERLDRYEIEVEGYTNDLATYEIKVA